MKDLELIKKGFNVGYLLQKHDPDLATKLLQSLKDQDIPYAQGYRAGVKEYAREKLIDQYKNKFKGKYRDRNLGKGRER